MTSLIKGAAEQEPQFALEMDFHLIYVSNTLGQVVYANNDKKNTRNIN